MTGNREDSTVGFSVGNENVEGSPVGCITIGTFVGSVEVGKLDTVIAGVLVVDVGRLLIFSG